MHERTARPVVDPAPPAGAPAMPDPDEPMTNEPLPIPADDTGIASVTSDDEKATEGGEADMPVVGETGHEAFDKARAEAERRRNH